MQATIAGYTRAMQVYLDGQPLTVPNATMATALRAGSDEAQRRGRVVVEVYVDGDMVSDTLLSDPPDEALGREMRLISVDPRLLVRETLLDAAEALDQARNEQTDSADKIQCGDVEGAMQPLQGAVQKWQAVRDAVEKSASLLEIPMEAKVGETERRLSDVINALATSLADVRRSLETEDWSALADLLAYDMVDQVKSWQDMMRALADGLKAP